MNDQNKASFSPGAIIGQRYELIRSLRSEAHGEVILARDQVLDVDVGLKLLSNEAPEFDRLLEYYRREALWGLRLHHPQILGVHHLDETGEGVFLVQEPFAGSSLWELLGHAEALTINDSLYFIEVLAQGLAFGHKQGVNHQNFNPQQVLVSATDGIKIINFAFPAEPAEIQIFPEIKAYIAPEIWQGRLPSAASNLFSLGVVGYRMLSGSFPFPWHPEGAVPYQVVADPLQFAKIPEALRPLFIRCLKLEPEKRFQTTADFLARLAALRHKLAPGGGGKPKPPPEELVYPDEPQELAASPSRPKPMEPEVEIDSGWPESPRQPSRSVVTKAKEWLAEQRERLTALLGPEPLRQNRHKQLAAIVGGGLAFLLVMFGLNSLFASKPQLKIAKPPEPVMTETAGPSLQAPAAAKPPVLAGAPGAPQEIQPEPASSPTPPSQAKPAVEVAAPAAAAIKPKKPAAPPPVAKPEKPAAKPEKPAPKPAPAAAQPAKPATAAKLVATLDKETAARQRADALSKQGQPAVVRKAKKGDKTVYQVWLTAAAPAAKPASPGVKPR